MTRFLLFTTVFLSIFPMLIRAQCSFDPTITPDDTILCPDEYATLTTQEYDSYQWFRDGDSIVGATSQTLTVDYYNYAGSTITVAATDNGCTETSPGVLVDGWVFLLPYVINGGNYNYTGEAFEVCLNDTITFELGLPYNTDIVWTADGVPISGETSSLLELTSSVPTGIINYGVCGSTEICPTYRQCLGVPLYVKFVDCTSGIEAPMITTRIYPNPATNTVFVETDHTISNSGYIIYDQLGRVVSSGKISPGTTEIEMRDLPSGVYILRLAGQENQAIKLIKN